MDSNSDGQLRRPTSARLYIVLAAVILLFCFFAIVISAAHYQRRAAEQFLRDYSSSQVGTATFADANDLVRKYRGKVASSQCGAEKCSFSMQFNNRWLSTLRLAPPTRLITQIEVERGKVVGRYTQYMLGVGPVAPFILVSEPPRDSQVNPLWVHGWWSGDDLWRMFIRVRPDASREQHDVAYSFDLR